MTRNLIFLLVVLIVSLSMTCYKKQIIPKTAELESLQKKVVITHSKTYRNDVPPPSATPWWSIDEHNLDSCQSFVWKYVKWMYPITEDNYWDYKLYGLVDEPADELKNRDLIRHYTYFFKDTLLSDVLRNSTMDCQGIDTSFFIQALGQPTCRSYNANTKQINFFYFFKLLYRHGPCHYIFDEGEQFERHCWPFHFQYCASMKMRFSKETGEITYIDFMGSG